MRESLFYVLLGGPAEALIRSANEQGSDKTSAALVRAVQPVSLIMDAKDAILGHGSYKNMDGIDRFSTFLQRGVTISKPAKVWAATMGLSDANVKLDAAISGFYRWKRNEGLLSGTSGIPADVETRNFRTHMKIASNKIKQGKNASREILAALRLSGKSPKSAAATLNGKRLLKRLNNQQLQSLRKRIGDDAYGKLQRYDALLNAWADAYSGR